MPTLIIDGRSVTVAEGKTILQAAEEAGVRVPHFCWHRALGALGACRLCAVTVLEGPQKGVRMACLTPAMDGMKVSTLDESSWSMRRSVIEWLMANHPHDCPVCDEGGECLLQDMTVAANHAVRRQRGRKRTHLNQDLGPFIEHEMNRCIACYRCVRAYRDYCGGDDFGVLGSRDRVYFGRFRPGRLSSPFSGNLADVCPTGTLTDKTFRFRARPWDLEEAPSVCPHCALGCAVIPGARYRELLRVRADPHPEPNDGFLCDRGRFGHGYHNRVDRPRRARLDGREVPPAEALDALRERVERVAGQHGPEAVLWLGSARATLEANALLLLWARRLGAAEPIFDLSSRRHAAAWVFSRIGAERRASLADVRRADLAVVCGADVLAEGPLLALALRQAFRGGATIHVLDPRPVELPCPAERRPLAPRLLPEALRLLAGGDGERLDAEAKDGLLRVRDALYQARRPVVIGGADLLGPEGAATLRRIAAAGDGRDAKVALLLPGPSSFACARLAASPPDAGEMARRIGSKDVRALVALEADPLGEALPKFAADLGRVEVLAALDCLPTETVRRASVFLPGAGTYEQAGAFADASGRVRAFEPALRPGVPIRQMLDGGHPPRTFSREIPGGEAAPAWEMLARILGLPPALRAVREELERVFPVLRGLSRLRAETRDELLLPGDDTDAPLPPAAAAAPEELRLLLSEPFAGWEILSAHAPDLDVLRPEAAVALNPADRAGLGLAPGDRVRVESEGLSESRIVREADIPRGLVWATRRRGSELSRLPAGEMPACRLRREGDP